MVSGKNHRKKRHVKNTFFRATFNQVSPETHVGQRTRERERERAKLGTKFRAARQLLSRHLAARFDADSSRETSKIQRKDASKERQGRGTRVSPGR